MVGRRLGFGPREEEKEREGLWAGLKGDWKRERFLFFIQIKFNSNLNSREFKFELNNKQ